ncbi:Choline/ethanolamine kinase [Allopseudospirillum japonicum]|uniref:Choline/ethanolamine kinase n=1 Tax=Allopseudospirillum japonicum TaxID=64971 RepID=A0A1H6QCV2_9GAMM|nr:phosphotransferase [Allopseudospirillum japonicum]SEI37390.1 Choline/ethanolamine kinase [Allopseudospirillum japonicum]
MFNNINFSQQICTQVYENCQKYMPQIEKIPANAWQPMRKGSTNQLWCYQDKVLRINADDKYLLGVNRQLEREYLNQLKKFKWAPRILAYAPKSTCLPAGAYLMPLYQKARQNKIKTSFFIALLKALACVKPIEPQEKNYYQLFAEYKKYLPSYDWHEVDYLINEYHKLPKVNAAVTHHDLHQGNIMYDSEKNSLILLDFEYFSYANPWFDWVAVHSKFNIKKDAIFFALRSDIRLTQREFNQGLAQATLVLSQLEKVWYKIYMEKR